MSKKDNNQGLDDFRDWVRQKYRQDLDPVFLFHNWTYSAEIEESVQKLAKKDSDISDSELIALRVAALAYPLGCVELDPKEVGEELIQSFQESEGLPEFNEHYLGHSQELLSTYLQENRDFRRSFEDSDPVTILANIKNDTEQGKAEKLLLDAVHGWYGRNRFKRRSELMSLELQGILGDTFDLVTFEHTLQEKMMSYGFETAVAKKSFDEKRRKNIRNQQKSLLETEKIETRRKTGKDLGRGIDTMYRTAFRNHINLSRIADGKANMMISINTIILSILLAVSGAGIGFFQDLIFERPLMLLPLIALLLSSLVAVIFAVFSARPNVTEYRVKKTKGIVNNPNASLLYFGNFLKLEKTDFIKHLDKMKYNQDELYQDLAKDLYDLGQVLQKKYFLLTISYNTFVGGLALSVLLFLIVYGIQFW
ncbi:MAG: Pycsar system effector family protein [Bacteroidota bacterium]